MKDITANEMDFVLRIFKNPERDYNASSIAKDIGISAMGALKIARRLEKGNILKSKLMGRAIYYTLNIEDDYVQQYIRFLLKREVEQATPHVKRWVTDIRKIKSADSAILFGSVLKKHEAKDIDVLLITDRKRFAQLKREIEEINLINVKKLHPIYQTREDFKSNIKNEDKVALNAIKGLVVFGEETIIKLVEK